MKKISTLLACVLLQAILVSVSFASEIIIFNDCDFPLNAVRIHKVDTASAYNLLESPLAAKEAIKVSMRDEDAIWNILAEDPAGSTVTFENINFNNIKQIHIKGDGTVEIYR